MNLTSTAPDRRPATREVTPRWMQIGFTACWVICFLSTFTTYATGWAARREISAVVAEANVMVEEAQRERDWAFVACADDGATCLVLEETCGVSP